jgi:hypothetical protein
MTKEEEPPDIKSPTRIITPPRILYVAGESERQDTIYRLLKDYCRMDCERVNGLEKTKGKIDTGRYQKVFVMTYNGKGQDIARYAMERGLGAVLVSGAENAADLERKGAMVLSGDDNLDIYDKLDEIRKFLGYNGDWKKTRLTNL